MGAQLGTVLPGRDLTHSAAHPQEVSGAANAEGYFGGNVVPKFPGAGSGLLFSPYPKYPNHVPLYDWNFGLVEHPASESLNLGVHRIWCQVDLAGPGHRAMLDKNFGEPRGVGKLGKDTRGR